LILAYGGKHKQSQRIFPMTRCRSIALEQSGIDLIGRLAHGGGQRPMGLVKGASRIVRQLHQFGGGEG